MNLLFLLTVTNPLDSAKRWRPETRCTKPLSVSEWRRPCCPASNFRIALREKFWRSCKYVIPFSKGRLLAKDYIYGKTMQKNLYRFYLQVIEYLFTDLQVPERFGHALEVYKSFNKRATALTQWLKQVWVILV